MSKRSDTDFSHIRDCTSMMSTKKKLRNQFLVELSAFDVLRRLSSHQFPGTNDAAENEFSNILSKLKALESQKNYLRGPT